LRMSENNITRRSFLDWITDLGVFALLGSIFYPVIRYLIPPRTGEATKNQIKLKATREEIAAEPQKAKYFKMGRLLGIIFITDSGELKALTATCTHLDCTVQNRPDWGIIWCACHNGKYDYDGNNISGPPPRPLEKLIVNEVGGDIFISREKT